MSLWQKYILPHSIPEALEALALAQGQAFAVAVIPVCGFSVMVIPVASACRPAFSRAA